MEANAFRGPLGTDDIQPQLEDHLRSEGPGKQNSSMLHSVVRRRNSLTLPSKRSSKHKSNSVTMKKRISMPFFPKYSSNTQDNSDVLKSPRPLPPSPPSREYLKSILEQEAESESLGGHVIDIPSDNPGPEDNLSNNILNECSSTESLDEKLEMLLSDALKRFSKRFPLRLRFIEGYCSEDSEHNLSANEVYDILNVNNIPVVSLRDKDGFMHQIPLESPTMFGLVYNPFSNYDEALNGYKFETCKEIMAANPLPTIVCAINTTTSYANNVKNDIFVVKGVQKNKLRGKRFLKVFNVCTQEEKLLSEDYHGHFTTKPSLIRLHLPQIVESIAKPFPVQAVIYVDNQAPSLEFLISSGVITLCGFKEETSLLAKPITEADLDEYEEELPLTIHLNENMMELDVEVMKWNDGAQTIIDGSSDYDDIVVPKSNPCENGIYDDVITTPSKVTSDEDTYAIVGAQEQIERHTKAHDPGYNNLSNDISLNPREKTEDFASFDLTLQRILEKLTALEHSVSKLSPISDHQKDEETSANKTKLAGLNEDEVTLLLERMDLSTYAAKFKTEHVTGSILLGCDDCILKGDLGVNSAVHRLRLLEITSGKLSVNYYSH